MHASQYKKTTGPSRASSRPPKNCSIRHGRLHRKHEPATDGHRDDRIHGCLQGLPPPTSPSAFIKSVLWVLTAEGDVSPRLWWEFERVWLADCLTPHLMDISHSDPAFPRRTEGGRNRKREGTASTFPLRGNRWGGRLDTQLASSSTRSRSTQINRKLRDWNDSAADHTNLFTPLSSTFSPSHVLPHTHTKTHTISNFFRQNSGEPFQLEIDFLLHANRGNVLAVNISYWPWNCILQ